MENSAFQNLNLSPELIRAIDELQYAEATEIQQKAIPLILSGRDVLGRSATGTGKTAAFGIPAVERIAEGTRPQVLILCPTRELAMQISGELRKYSRYKSGVHIATVYGGQPMEPQIRELKIANLVVGTPGRVMDHMRRRTLKLDQLHTVILDEADEMFNMGFYEDICTILSQAPEERQTLLFSATMPPAILKITEEFQKDPTVVTVDPGRRTVDSIAQHFYQVPQPRKMDALNLLLQYYDPERAVIFCNTKKMVEELTEYLNSSGFKAAGLHGDMRQPLRTQVMHAFKTGRTRLLIATDVAARGIDVEDVSVVFNYDIPQEFEYYIHRIGRTGRAGRSGVSVTLACGRQQMGALRAIERYVGASIEEKPLPQPEAILHKRQEKFLCRVRSAMSGESNGQWHDMVTILLEEGYPLETVADTLMGMLCGKDSRPIPLIQPVPRTPRPDGRPRSARVRIRMDAGRSQKMAPNYILGAIVDSTGLPAGSVGKIDIRPEYSTVELSPEDAALVLERMQDARIRNRKVSFSAMPDHAEDFRRPSARRPGRSRRNRWDGGTR